MLKTQTLIESNYIVDKIESEDILEYKSPDIPITDKRLKIIDNKQKCVNLLGGKCSCCGYDKHLTSLQFHHVFPDKKEYQISMLYVCSMKKYDVLLKELDKCCVLCANCHMAFESSELKLNFIKDILGYKVNHENS